MTKDTKLLLRLIIDMVLVKITMALESEVKISLKLGANLVANFASGMPYSRSQIVTGAALLNPQNPILMGEPYGSRKPWNFRADSQIDRNIALSFGSGESKKKKANLNIYLLMTNVFNTLNVLDVYRATGNAGDDGYLNAVDYQNSITQQNSEATFRYLYALKANDPYNFEYQDRLDLVQN